MVDITLTTMNNAAVRLVSAFVFLAPVLPAFAADALADRIARIENGLMPATALQGRPVPKTSISQRMAALQVPGASVAVINNGAIEWARGYGVAQAGKEHAVNPETLFQAASVSKLVTALGALHLVETGKLSLDEDINNKLGSWKLPAGAQSAEFPVTIRNLLNHSAGTTVSGFRGYAAGEAVPTLLQILDGTKPANSEPVRVVSRPGQQWNYSGGGYGIVQQAMTDVSGKSFASLMAEIVFNPLGMKHSTFAQPASSALERVAATGHDENGKPIKGRWHTYPEQAAAGLWTTPSDLARLAIGLQQASAGKSNKVIAQAMAAQMLTRLKGNYGLGIALDEVKGRPSFNHGGKNVGYQTMLYALAKEGQGAVIMTNGDRGDALAGDILRSIAAEYKWSEWQVIERPTAPVAVTTLARYAGSYRLGSTTITVTQKQGRLFIAPTPYGPEPMELHPSSQTDFFNLNDDMEFAFESNHSGGVDLIIKGQEPRKAIRIL